MCVYIYIYNSSGPEPHELAVLYSRLPAMAAAGDEPGMVEVTLRAVGPSRPTTLRLPPLLSVGNTPRTSVSSRLGCVPP
jgi:hypothetical protein